MEAPSKPEHGGRLARGYARIVVAFRHVIILAWVAGAIASTQLPHITDADAGSLDGFVSQTSPAIQTEIASIDAFGFPLVSRTVLVQRDPDGLSPFTRAEAVLNAVALTQGSYPEAKPLLGALPVTNTTGIIPGSSERGTTALTYLFARPGAGFGTQTRAARRFADDHIGEPEDGFVGVTGSIPARVAQGRILADALPMMEIATVGVILTIVAVTFRALAAPLLALGTAGIAFVIAVRLSGLAGFLLGIPIPSELEPLILALLLGVVTDYVIFFLTGMHRALRAGSTRLEAARAATVSFGPIVAVAGFTVAAGTAAVTVAESAFFRAFGPAMALAVGVALLVSLTLVPALMAVFGRALFWPAAPRPRDDQPPEDGPPEDVPAEDAPSDDVPAEDAGGPRSLTAGWVTRKPVAAIVVLACAAGLGLAAAPLRDLELGVGFVASLPASTEARTAAAAAAAGFTPGILSPTVLLLEEDNIAAQRTRLARLGNLLAEQPGVAGAVGPGDLVPQLERRVLTSPNGDAARFLIVLEHAPLGAPAINTVEGLSEALPLLLTTAGLDPASSGLSGDTAVSAELVETTRNDLARIAIAALLVNLVLLIVFLRSLVAPVYLLACSVLALAAALGAMTFVFQGLLSHAGITFYVPFAAAVLLLSLGSDYNIFGVGHIWAKARHLPHTEAIRQGLAETTHAITAAGITLAASFATLAVVPLRPFRELAFVMAVGILLDALVVRSLLVPALITLVGRVSGWPWAAMAKVRHQREETGGSE